MYERGQKLARRRNSSRAPKLQRAKCSKHGCAARRRKGKLELARPERPVSNRHAVRKAAMRSVAHAADRPPSAPRPPATSSAPAQGREPVCHLHGVAVLLNSAVSWWWHSLRTGFLLCCICAMRWHRM